MENPVRKLRKALGLSQVEFGRLLDRSHQSIRNYEAGVQVPPDVIERLRSIAAERGLADLAVELSSDAWQVNQVFRPGKTFISQGKTPHKTSRAGSSEWHDLLDEVLNSGMPDAIDAVQKNLLVFGNYVRSRRPGDEAKKRKVK